MGLDPAGTEPTAAEAIVEFSTLPQDEDFGIKPWMAAPVGVYETASEPLSPATQEQHENEAAWEPQACEAITALSAGEADGELQVVEAGGELHGEALFEPHLLTSPADDAPGICKFAALQGRQPQRPSWRHAIWGPIRSQAEERLRGRLARSQAPEKSSHKPRQRLMRKQPSRSSAMSRQRGCTCRGGWGAPLFPVEDAETHAGEVVVANLDDATW